MLSHVLRVKQQRKVADVFCKHFDHSGVLQGLAVHFQKLLSFVWADDASEVVQVLNDN